MECPLVVTVRCRAITSREAEMGAVRVPHRAEQNYSCVEVRDATTLVVADPDATSPLIRRDRVYTFDRVFGRDATNPDVYDATIGPLVPALLQGYNATCFAYGMTGAGKTYTMVGDDASGVRGLCALCVDSLFCEEARLRREHGAVMTIHASYLEIYNEKIKDLLVSSTAPSNSKSGSSLDIVEDPSRGVHVVGLTEVLVTTIHDLQSILVTGTERRTMAPTGSNVASSRSHAVLQLNVRVSDGMECHSGRLMLIDLAGSERASYATQNQHQHTMSAASKQKANALRTLEGANINKSLLALGNCITQLGAAANTGTTPMHVPYRDSRLTRLLKDSLGGNTRTAMIATVSPSCLCYEETLATLKYATRARFIRKKVYRNKADTTSPTSSELEAVRASLLSEIHALRTQISVAQRANSVAFSSQSPNNNNNNNNYNEDSHSYTQQQLHCDSERNNNNSNNNTSYVKERERERQFRELVELREEAFLQETSGWEELLCRARRRGPPSTTYSAPYTSSSSRSRSRSTATSCLSATTPAMQQNQRPLLAERNVNIPQENNININKLAWNRKRSPVHEKVIRGMAERRQSLEQINELLFSKQKRNSNQEEEEGSADTAPSGTGSGLTLGASVLRAALERSKREAAISRF